MHPAIYIFAGGALLIGVIVYLVRKYEQKRTAELTEVFRDLSFRSMESPGIPDFSITSRGHSRKRTNSFEGRTSGLDLSIFDYRYTVGGGKNQTAYKFTMVMTETSCPVFQLYKEGLFQKIADKFSKKDIDFEGYPIFSDKYVLKGDDEQAVRTQFSPDVLLFFENNDWCGESNGNQIVFWKHYRRIKPERMNEFLNEVKSCFKLFVKSAF
ncbi:MAG: hypothetical protein HQ515_09645 [Phycisphaeraceae bacterium]|nr:hypothetical protein [Phycisphaeraceae bacterium]